MSVWQNLTGFKRRRWGLIDGKIHTDPGFDADLSWFHRHIRHGGLGDAPAVSGIFGVTVIPQFLGIRVFFHMNYSAQGAAAAIAWAFSRAEAMALVRAS